jgi:cytoskeletal protein CcmA (bactofilin family)
MADGAVIALYVIVVGMLVVLGLMLYAGVIPLGKIKCSGVTVDGKITASGDVTATGDVTVAGKVVATGDVSTAGNLWGNQVWFTGGANIQSDAAGKLIFNNHPGFQFNESVGVSGGTLTADALWLTKGGNIQTDTATGILHLNNTAGFVFGGEKVEIDSDLHVVSSISGTTTTGGNIIADQKINAGSDIYTPASVAAGLKLYAADAVIGNVNGNGWVYTNGGSPYVPGTIAGALTAGYTTYPGINGSL